MQYINFDVFDKNIDAYMDQIAAGNKEVTVIRENGENIVLLSMEMYNKMMEKLYGKMEAK